MVVLYLNVLNRHVRKYWVKLWKNIWIRIALIKIRTQYLQGTSQTHDPEPLEIWLVGWQGAPQCLQKYICVCVYLQLFWALGRGLVFLCLLDRCMSPVWEKHTRKTQYTCSLHIVQATQYTCSLHIVQAVCSTFQYTLIQPQTALLLYNSVCPAQEGGKNKKSVRGGGGNKPDGGPQCQYAMTG
jgi:hypothetical protein